MLKFLSTDKGVDFEYQQDKGINNKWVMNSLKENQEVQIASRIFSFQINDLLLYEENIQDIDGDDHVFRFKFGTYQGDYLRIPGRVLNSKNDLLIGREVTLKRSIFAAERNISIFGWISKLLEHSDPIVIGGNRPDSIPWSVFEELIKKFPNTGELNRYAGSRVQTILAQYLNGMKDVRSSYEKNLNKSSSSNKITELKINIDELKKAEIEKYIFIQKMIKDFLKTKQNLSENEWQKLMLNFLLLLFPKYIKILEKITVYDHYTNSQKIIKRQIDVGLVDANGNLDIIEVKKPFDDKIFRKGKYRDNSIPTAELSGSIMQAEKYLFHLSKWGVAGEKKLTETYASILPNGMKIRISSPKAIIIVGRDEIAGAKMSDSELLDFEVIKRKYANVMDIITYDDLVRRLDNTIAALKI